MKKLNETYYEGVGEIPVREIDFLPFAILRRQYHVAFSLILREKPHILSALELYNIGCSIRELHDDGSYSVAEMVIVKGLAYRQVERMQTNSSAMISNPQHHLRPESPSSFKRESDVVSTGSDGTLSLRTVNSTYVFKSLYMTVKEFDF
jgi:hypothetical protein